MRGKCAGIILAVLLHADIATAACGLTSFYGAESGTHTANGERFKPMAMTAAHRTLPFGTMLQVSYQGKTVTVRVNDRGPASCIKWRGHCLPRRDLDLSHGAARALGMVGSGVVRACWS